MTKRFFLNNSGGSGRKASDIFKDSVKKGNGAKLTPTERAKKMVDAKMAEMRGAGAAKKFAFSLPGTAKGEEKQESEALKQMKAKIAEKRSKRESKNLQDEVRIEGKYFSGMQGGRIDSKGNIFNAHNQQIASVDLKNGKIVGKSGITIGKYVNNSPTAEYVITRYIAKMNNTTGRGGVSGGPEASFDNMMGGIDSSTPKSSGSIWGKGRKKKDSGWW